MKPYVEITVSSTQTKMIRRRATETEPESIIPMDPDNRDYQEYLVWLSADNTPDVEERS